MLRLLICVLLSVFFPYSLEAQFLEPNHYKTLTTQRIVEKISAAAGDSRIPPKLFIYSKKESGRLIAKMLWKPVPKLIIDELVYDMCISQFGTDSLDALACIVGHELAHFYKEHKNTPGFAKTNAGTLVESEADMWGVFSASLAGYAAIDLLPQVINEVYAKYELPDQIPGYPSKQERIASATTKLEEVAPFIHLFEAGQLLYLTKYFEEAYACFDYILQRFPSREVYNNAGLCKLEQLLSLTSPEDFVFALPLELDANSRLPQDKKRPFTFNIDSRKAQLLDESIKLFRKAISLDKIYAPAAINLASAYTLQANYPAAIGLINELEINLQAIGQSLPPNASLVKGIAFTMDKQDRKAGRALQLAKAQAAFKADYNLSIFNALLATDWFDVEDAKLKTYFPQMKPQIDKVFNANYSNTLLKPENTIGTYSFGALDALQPDVSLRLNNGGLRFKLQKFANDQMNAYRIITPSRVRQDRDLEISFMVTKNQFKGATQLGIARKASLNQVRSTYGRADYSYAGNANTSYQYFERAGLLFKVADQQVKQWIIYQERPYFR